MEEGIVSDPVFSKELEKENDKLDIFLNQLDSFYEHMIERTRKSRTAIQGGWGDKPAQTFKLSQQHKIAKAFDEFVSAIHDIATSQNYHEAAYSYWMKRGSEEAAAATAKGLRSDDRRLAS